MSQPLSTFFENGKMDADFEVKEGYVVGLCVLYAQRTAKEQEYMIRERSIVMIENRDLSECVQMAKDLACQSALSRLSGLPATSAADLAQKPAKQKIQQPLAVVTTPPSESALAEEAKDTAGLEEEQPVSSEDLETEAPKEEEVPILSGARQVGFADLRPASSLFIEERAPQQSAAPELDEAEDAIEKAKEMKITILGKLHECSGWTAGKILEERPEVIVEFANRYNGPKVEERNALRTLYTEALRRVDRAA